MSIVDLGAKLKAGADVKAGPELDLAKKIVLPHMEKLVLDCANCGGKAFAIGVSPLKGEVKTAAVVRRLVCIRCAAGVNVEDGLVHGRESAPLIKPNGG